MGRSVLRPYVFVREIWNWMRLTVGVGATRIGEYPSDWRGNYVGAIRDS
jgi:hypothetical protein